MSQLSKVTYSRHQWKDKAKQRGDRERYQRKQLARISAERDRVTKALKEAQARLRQLEAHMQGLVALPKVDVVWMALQLFLVVRIGFGYPRKAGHLMTSTSWRHGLMAFSRPGQ